MSDAWLVVSSHVLPRAWRQEVAVTEMDAAPGTGEELAVVAAVRAGGASAFSSLTERYRRELLVHCYRMLGNLEDAEDLVQETFLRAWRNGSGFEGRSTLRAWLYRIATNACLDAIKRSRRRVRVVDVPPAKGRPPSFDEVPRPARFPARTTVPAGSAGTSQRDRRRATRPAQRPGASTCRSTVNTARPDPIMTKSVDALLGLGLPTRAGGRCGIECR